MIKDITLWQLNTIIDCFLQIQHTSMKIPSTPTATAVLAMHGINSRRPPLATPPPSNYMKIAILTINRGKYDAKYRLNIKRKIVEIYDRKKQNTSIARKSMAKKHD